MCTMNKDYKVFCAVRCQVQVSVCEISKKTKKNQHFSHKKYVELIQARTYSYSTICP